MSIGAISPVRFLSKIRISTTNGGDDRRRCSFLFRCCCGRMSGSGDVETKNRQFIGRGVKIPTLKRRINWFWILPIFVSGIGEKNKNKFLFSSPYLFAWTFLKCPLSCNWPALIAILWNRLSDFCAFLPLSQRLVAVVVRWMTRSASD